MNSPMAILGALAMMPVLYSILRQRERERHEQELADARWVDDGGTVISDDVFDHHLDT